MDISWEDSVRDPPTLIPLESWDCQLSACVISFGGQYDSFVNYLRTQMRLCFQCVFFHYNEYSPIKRYVFHLHAQRNHSLIGCYVALAEFSLSSWIQLWFAGPTTMKNSVVWRMADDAMFAMVSSCPAQVAVRADRCLGGQFSCAPMYYGVYFPIVDVQIGGWGVFFGDEKGSRKSFT